MKLPKLRHYTVVKNLLIAFLTIKSVMCFLLVITGFTIIGADKEYPIQRGIVFAYKYDGNTGVDVKPEDTLMAKLSLVSLNTTNANNGLIGYEIIARGTVLFVLHQYGVYSVQTEHCIHVIALSVLLISWEVVTYLFLDIYTVFLVIDIIFISFLIDFTALVILGLKPIPQADEEERVVSIQEDNVNQTTTDVKLSIV